MKSAKPQSEILVSDAGKQVMFGDELLLDGETPVTFLDYLETADWSDDAPDGDVRVQLPTGEARKVAPLRVSCRVEWRR